MFRSSRLAFVVRTPLACFVLLLFVSLVAAAPLRAQDWFKTETSSGADRIRIAVAGFKPASAEAQTVSLKQIFD